MFSKRSKRVFWPRFQRPGKSEKAIFVSRGKQDPGNPPLKGKEKPFHAGNREFSTKARVSTNLQMRKPDQALISKINAAAPDRKTGFPSLESIAPPLEESASILCICGKSGGHRQQQSLPHDILFSVPPGGVRGCESVPTILGKKRCRKFLREREGEKHLHKHD